MSTPSQEVPAMELAPLFRIAAAGLAPASTMPAAPPAHPCCIEKTMYPIRHIYLPGKPLLLTVRRSVEVATAGLPRNVPSPDSLGVTTIQMPLTVTAGHSPRTPIITLSVRRLCFQSQMGQRAVRIDTDDPPTLSELQVCVGDTFLPLLLLRESPVHLQLDPAGGVTAIAGLEELVSQVRQAAPAAAPDPRLAADKLSAMLSSQVIEPQVYLPPQPVAMDESWQVDHVQYDFDLTSPAEECPREHLECTLAGVEPSLQGPVAVIQLRGLDPQASDNPAMPLISACRSGEVRVDLGANLFLSSRNESLSVFQPPTTGRRAPTTITIRSLVEVDLRPDAQ